MPEQVIRAGVDTYVDSSGPSSPTEGRPYVLLKNGERRGLITMPIVIPAGRVVLSATLSGLASWPNVACTIGVAAIGAPWTPSKVNWTTQPSVTGPTINTAIPARSANQRFTLDVTALVQAIANGQPNYGWRLATSTGDIHFRSFETGVTPWVLTIVTSDVPSVPSQLTPAGKTSLAKWVCRVEDYEDLSTMQVRVDANKTAPYDWQSAPIATTIPQVDLSTAAGDTGYASAFPGLADGSATCWQVRVKTVDGEWSPWSDWVEINRTTKPEVTLVVPDGTGLVKDPTPTVTATLWPDGTDATRWQVLIASTADPATVLYDSSDALTGAVLEHTVPLMWNNHPVMGSDGDYRVTVRCWDDPERVPSMGDPTYVEVFRDFALETDGVTNPPSTIRALQKDHGHPGIVLRFTRTGPAPDRFLILRNGKHLAVVDASDVEVADGTWEYTDLTPRPWAESVYRVRAIEDGKQSHDSAAASITPAVEGVWILSEFGDVLLYDTDVASFRKKDKRTTYELPYSSEDVDIVTAIAGYSCDSADFAIDNRGEQDVDTAKAIIEKIRKQPHVPVALVWATESIRAYLKNLQANPDPEILPGRNRRHIVSFGFAETQDS